MGFRVFCSSRVCIGSEVVSVIDIFIVGEDDRKSERATSRISCERDPGVKRRGRESL